MYCRKCGASIPDDSVFCMKCGERVIAVLEAEPQDTPVPVTAEVGGTKRFTFPKNTTYDQASIPVNAWLEENGVKITGARFQLDAVLLMGTMVPTISEVEIDWLPEETGAHYILGVMLDSRSDFGLGKKKGARNVQRQFDRWLGQHPEYEIAGKQDDQLSIGWTSAWITCFFYRRR